MGSILLLLRQAAAIYLFILSLLGVIVTMVHTIGVAGSAAGFDTFEIFMMILMPLLVAAYLVWYAKLARHKAWIR